MKAVFLIDCGQASRKTNGFPNGIYFELATPPLNYTLFPG